VKLDELRKRLRAPELESQADDTAKPKSNVIEADSIELRIGDASVLRIGQSVSVTTYAELIARCRDCEKKLGDEDDDHIWRLCRECAEKRQLMGFAITSLSICEECRLPFKGSKALCPDCEAKP